MPKPARHPENGVPNPWRADIDRILLTQEQIATRIQELARDINRDFAGRDTVVVAVLNGTIMFLADLLRHLALPLRLDFVGVASYGSGTTSGDLSFTKQTSIDVRSRDVLVVDDILDTGKTLDRVTLHLRQFKPRRLRTCVLLDKKARRQIKIRGDYTGFQIPDEFVVGYGLDFAERYRNLPFIGVLKPEIFQGGAIVRPHSTPSLPRQPAVGMTITVRYWSWFKDLAGTDLEAFTVPADSALGDLLECVRTRHPRFLEVRQSTLVAVGVEYQPPSHPLRDGDEVSLFPPVQGG